jgi:hypothetical protein
MDIIQLDVTGFALNASNKATTKTKIDKTLYSALRNAIAPAEILLLILSILSVPTSCFVTQDVLK